MRLVVALAVLLVAACGGTPNDCACTISSGDASANLICGGTACVAGYEYGCSEDEVVLISQCAPDLSIVVQRNDMGRAICMPLGSQCLPGQSTCCSSANDDGGLSPTCDSVSGACCVPTGSACQSSTECCAGHACVVIGGQYVCGS